MTLESRESLMVLMVWRLSPAERNLEPVGQKTRVMRKESSDEQQLFPVFHSLFKPLVFWGGILVPVFCFCNQNELLN